ncbi:MAG TPA: HAD family hydrolase [Myxococcales bacterium]|jgi:phosphoglycolate phosphatase-like HAD superfamily hydrolase|nr:HAD family hydrolase [Myxococcales bacterium]
MRALLFDIDGTLTRSAGAGTRALAQAVGARPRAAEELRKMRLDGMTDRAIARALLAAERHGAASDVSDTDIDAVLAQYLAALEHECAAKAYLALPGVTELLPRLAARADVVLGLCTGNVESGARLKLGCAGIWQYFRFGGYGSDAEPRPEIVRVAWRRARDRGATEALVIGDTPRDILAAHDAGLPACAVATGRWSIHDLGTHGPEVVLKDFTDTARTEELLLGPV